MNELEFDAQTHTYRYYGRVVPSVTQILQPWSGLDFVDRDQLEAARVFGTHVHQACHLANIGELDQGSLEESVAAYLEGWFRFQAESGFVVLESEARVFHAKLHYAGTLDVIGMFPDDKEPWLVDLKTGSTVPSTVGPQTAAYAAARGKRTRRACCLLKPNSYAWVPLKDIVDYDRFNMALGLYRWKPLPNQGPQP